MKVLFYKATVITLLILCASLVLAYFLNDYRINFLSESVHEMNYELLDITVSMELMDYYSDCNSLLKYMAEYDHKVALIGQYLAETDTKDDDVMYNQLASKYNYLNLVSWIRHNKIYDQCGVHGNDLVLYIYDMDDLDSQYQGNVLDKLVDDYDIKVFAVASYMNTLPMNMILNSVDNNGEFPILIIGTDSYVGFKHDYELVELMNLGE